MNYLKGLNSAYINKEDLIKTIRKIYKSINFDEIIRQWIGVGIIESPQACLHIHAEHIKELRLSKTGRFYLSEFKNSLSYIQIIKDDIEMGELKIPNIVVAKNVSEKINSVLLFLNWLIEQERQELKEISNRGEKDLNAFIIFGSDNLCITCIIAENILNEIRWIYKKYQNTPEEFKLDERLIEEVQQKTQLLTKGYNFLLEKTAYKKKIGSA